MKGFVTTTYLIIFHQFNKVSLNFSYMIVMLHFYISILIRF